MFKYIGVFIILCFSKNVFANFNPVFIEGYISKNIHEALSANEIIIKIKNSTNQNSTGYTYYVPIIKKNGYFKIEIPVSTEYSYLSFEMEDQLNKGRVQNLADEKWQVFKTVFLFNAGDSIKFDAIKIGKIRFYGRGSEKLNCQSQINEIEVIPDYATELINDMLAKHKFKMAIEFKKKIVRNAIESRLLILNTYYGRIEDTAYQLIYLDAIYSAEAAKIRPIINWNERFLNTIDLNDLLEDQYVKIKDDLLNNSAVKSAYLDDYLVEKLYSSIIINNHFEGDQIFKELYYKLKDLTIKSNNKKLLFILFERYGRLYFNAAKLLIDEALIISKDSDFEEPLLKWKTKQFKAYPFLLTDKAGVIHELKDYKGKLIVMDFWYTGCPNCIVLNKAMAPVTAHFINRKDIVFITVSIDKDKEVWLKSINTGNYTSKESINLYTRGLGPKDGLIENYNFISYPSQLIIDKGGNLISSNPPRVDIIDNYKRFIFLIEQNLESVK